MIHMKLGIVNNFHSLIPAPSDKHYILCVKLVERTFSFKTSWLEMASGSGDNLIHDPSCFEMLQLPDE